MSIRLIILLMLPLNALAETWVCAFNDGSMGEYKRVGNTIDGEKIIFEDSESFISVHTQHLYAKTLIFNKKKQTLSWATNDHHHRESRYQFNQCKVIK
jgi:hypothetical protein